METQYQFAPYFAAYQIGNDIHVGGLPPNAAVIEDAPGFLSDFIGYMGTPRLPGEMSEWLRAAGLSEDEATSVLDQLIDSSYLVPALQEAESRYSRHHLYYQLLGLDPIVAQEKLRSSTVGIVGTGGIGSNVATLLAAAGVGHLVMSDGDTVELSNLTRQTLYDESTVGESKVSAAAQRILAINSEVSVTTVQRGFDGPELIRDHFSQCDFLVLSADSPREVHEWLCAEAVQAKIPYSSAGYIEGYAVVGPLVIPGKTACYECTRRDADIFRYEGDGGTPPRLLNSRVQMPSYGPLNFHVASVQANEVIRHIVGLSTQTSGARALVDFSDYKQTLERFDRQADCPACGDLEGSRAEEGGVLEKIAKQYEAERAENSFNSLLLDPLMGRIIPKALKDGCRALDVGCGTGDMSRLVASYGYQVDAVDIEPAMLEIARTATSDGSVAYRQASLTDLQQGDQYDLILCLNVLDWVEDLEDAVRRLRELLKPGGELIISVPHPFKDSGTWAKSWNGERWVYDDFAVTGHYFSEGPIEKSREDAQGNTTVRRTVTFKRTLETYVRMIAETGLILHGLYEPAPGECSPGTEILVEKSARVPYFLVLHYTAPETGV
ncbi:ThiF family adenylyltransferase [Streptomyces sp. NPDC058286]|uniref:ThiF family adenylyltransferase n=1 Tax=Streptomyces sp. NPDC058286 TaxID=3346422 RepID=UPI0036ECB0CF